ncbi:Hsp70 family protein [uncultured Corynebacterium sp.]|uniref:Hsp70 family protein n=1 Tax=uncultured Corynebacterium sp. TaxID=159447 RepID=UPI0025F28FAA|nr:Hsp70 family protein [uncultured Corynebacterium sp.]
MSGWRLAIDFGTSNTAAAHRAAGQGGPPAEALALSHQGNLLPSAVFADESGFAVGHVALNQAESRPDAFLPEPKRAIGSETALLGGQRHQVSEIIAGVLGAVADRARRFAGGSMPDDVVLTHPEAWGRAELARLVDAAERAGFERGRVSLVSEPRAATYWYSSRHPLSPGQKVAVFDFGGGTLDVAVLTPSADGSLQVIAARGDNSLGGRTLDARIRAWVEEELEENDTELLRALRSGAAGPALALDRSIRTAKEVLSEAPRATITVAAQGRETALVLTRGEFEELIAPDVDRALDVTRATLLDAGLRPDPSTALYLTGGSARIPYIQNRLGELATVATLDDPKTVVSRGALMGPTRRADDVDAGVTTWVGPGAIAGGAGSMAVPPVAPPQANQAAPAPHAQQAPQASQNQQAQQFAQQQQYPQQTPQRFAAAPGTAPGSVSTASSASAAKSGSKSGGSKLPVLALVGVAALLIVGGGAWALTPGGDEGGEGGGNGGTETATEATEQTETTAAAEAWPTPRLTENDEIMSLVQTNLPAELTDGMSNCSDTESIISVGLGTDSFPSYLCGYDSDTSQRTGMTIANVITDETAMEAVANHADRNESDLKEVANEGGTKVLMEENEVFSFFYYLDEPGGYVFRSGHFDDGDQTRAFLRDKGLI